LLFTIVVYIGNEAIFSPSSIEYAKCFIMPSGDERKSNLISAEKLTWLQSCLASSY
jgi:hypothetical protein